MGAELDELADLAGATTPARIAMVLDWPSWWALEMDSRPSQELSVVAAVRSWYEPLWRRGFSVDFVNSEMDLSDYRLILIPQLYSVSDRGARRVIDAAAAGSSVVIGFFSGAVDEKDTVRSGGYPAPWTDLLGIWIEEYRPLLPGTSIELAPTATGGHRARASSWSEHVHAEDAEVIFEYVDGDIAGCPAVTRRLHESGASAWYFSTALDAQTLDSLLLRVAQEAEVQPILVEAPPVDVEVAIRETPDRRYLFLLNHGDSARTVCVDDYSGSSWSRVGNDELQTHVDVAAGDVVILTSTREEAVATS